MAVQSSVSGLDSHLGYWLRYVSNHVSQAFARKVEARGVTVAEWVLMRHLLDEEPLAPSRLAEHMGMSRGAVSRLANRLVAKSLVVAAANPAAGRGQILSLTPAGRALVPELAALADANDAEFFGDLDPDAYATLLDFLTQFVERRGLKSEPVD